MGIQKSWSLADDKALLARRAANQTVPQIAEDMRRSKSSIWSRLAHLKRMARIARLVAGGNRET